MNTQQDSKVKFLVISVLHVQATVKVSRQSHHERTQRQAKDIWFEVRLNSKLKANTNKGYLFSLYDDFSPGLCVEFFFFFHDD